MAGPLGRSLWHDGLWPDVPLLVSLDNEPDLWFQTHARIHPDPVTYSELFVRTAEFAAAVKDVDNGVTVLAFVSYGDSGYVSLQGAPDAATHGEFIPWFLAAPATAVLHHFILAGAAPSITAGADVPAVAQNAFRVTLPAMSVSILAR